MVIGGRTSQGKTALGLQMAKDCAKQGFRTYFLSLEMSEESLVERLFCNVAEISGEALRGFAALGSEDRKKYDQLANDFYKVFLNDLPLVIAYNVGSTMDELMDMLDDLPKADVVFIDYLQAISKLEFDKLSTMNNYILGLRALANEKNFAAVLLSQINREAMDGKERVPHIWQLKGSGTIEEHADTVLLTHWDYFYSNAGRETEFQIQVAKQRNGSTGVAWTHFHPKIYKFKEFTTKEREEKREEYKRQQSKPERKQDIQHAKEIAEKDPTVKAALSTFNGRVATEEDIQKINSKKKAA